MRKPLSLLAGLLSASVASMLFKQVWKMVSGDDDAPDATDLDRTWREVLLAAALQGAVFGLVKAAVNRAGTQSAQRMSKNPASRVRERIPA